MSLPYLTQPQVEQIAKIMGDTANGFTGSEIRHHLQQCGINDVEFDGTKWVRLYNAFCNSVNSNGGSSNAIYAFIKHCFEPAQGLQNPDRYKLMRIEINKVLMLVGIEIGDDGQFRQIIRAQSLTEVQRRITSLRDKLRGYNAHERVISCCKEEFLTDDYFHAVHEAAKSLCDHVREMTGLTEDGTKLVETALSSKDPYILFGNVLNETGRNMQNGLKEMLNGVIHMIRNVTAHELRMHWNVNEREATDVLIQISYLHRILDQCDVVKRVP